MHMPRIKHKKAKGRAVVLRPTRRKARENKHAMGHLSLRPNLLLERFADIFESVCLTGSSLSKRPLPQGYVVLVGEKNTPHVSKSCARGML